MHYNSDYVDDLKEEIEKLKKLVAELLDDPLVLDGAPPGLGWFERAEVALSRPVGSTFDNAAVKRRAAWKKLAQDTIPGDEFSEFPWVKRP